MPNHITDATEEYSKPSFQFDYCCEVMDEFVKTSGCEPRLEYSSGYSDFDGFYISGCDDSFNRKVSYCPFCGKEITGLVIFDNA